MTKTKFHSKEHFIAIMTRLQDIIEDTENVRQALEKLNPESYSGFTLSRYEQLVIDLLDNMVEPNESYFGDGSSIISYYIYELDWGRCKIAKNCIKHTESGKTYSLRNLHELWQYIVSEIT